MYPYEQVKKEMRQLYDMGIRILFFCGGETFLWEDHGKKLRDLVIEAKEMGFLIVNTVTNGTFPIDLPEADLILLSLDGDKERHNQIRGNTYDRIMHHIRHASSDNICFYMAVNQIAVMSACWQRTRRMSVQFPLIFILHTRIPKSWHLLQKKRQSAAK